MSICHAVLFFIHIPSSYHAVALHESSFHQYHASMSLKRKFYSFFLWVRLDKAKSKNRKEKSKEGDDGGPLQQRKRSICTDSPRTASATSSKSPLPYSTIQ